MEEESGTQLVHADVHPISAVEQSQLEIQIRLAMEHPRDVAECIDTARSLINLDQTTAREAFYSLEHFGGAPIVGPSIRMAEMLASSWKHVTYGSRPLAVEEKQVRAQGICYDFQTNTRVMVEKTRPIVDKHGKPYTKQHLINNAMLAAQAIAERDAILKVIPRAYANKLMEEAMDVATGKGLSMGQKVESAIAAFSELDPPVPEQLLYAALGVQDSRSMNISHVQRLRTMYSTIKEGHTTIESYLPTADSDNDGSAATEAMAKMSAAALKAEEQKKPPAKKRAAAKKKEEPKPEPEPDTDGVVPEEELDRDALLIEYEQESAQVGDDKRRKVLLDVGSLDGDYEKLDAEQLKQAIALLKQ